MISSHFSRARQKLLAILLLQPSREFYLRELIRLSRLGQEAVQREIASLVRAEIILRRKHGNRVYYRANAGASIYRELKSIMVKTARGSSISCDLFSYKPGGPLIWRLSSVHSPGARKLSAAI